MEEVPTRIEPCFLSDSVPAELTELAADIRAEAAVLGQGLPRHVIADLAEIVRVANAYHSNAIEGHETPPADIEAALAGADGSTSPLALEAKAHVDAQRMIDLMAVEGDLPSPTSGDFISWIHQKLYEAMPDEFSSIILPDGQGKAIRPGAFRVEGDHEVVVGRHQPPSSNRVTAFMKHYSNRYRQVGPNALSRIIALPAAHHRLNYIHPFPDGNGRASRLMSHAMALDTGIGGHGLWSIARGLRIGLGDMTEYKRMMDHADHPRMGALDGRGNLSQKALITFSRWFLTTVLEQIRFACRIFSMEALETRCRDFIRLSCDDVAAPALMSAVQRRAMDIGDLTRTLNADSSEVAVSVTRLRELGVLQSTGDQGVLSIAFPVSAGSLMFPEFFSVTAA
jgi:Fic family protein|nr:Fic family protein [Neorhizobium tomejilense]